DPWLFRGGFLWTGLATVAVIMAVTHQGTITSRALGTPVLNWIGTRSYGLYLYHWPIYQIIRKQAGVLLTPAQFVIAMIATVALTEASYRYIETPIRKGRLMGWVRSVRGDQRVVWGGLAIGALFVVAAVSMALAPNRCVGDIECSLEVANALDDTTTTASAPSTVPVSQPSGGDTTSSVGSTTTVTTAPPEPKPYAVIGESVMAGAVAPLASGGGVVDAHENRGPQGTLDAIKAHLASGEIGPSTAVAIQVGTNMEVSADQLDGFIAQLPTQPVTFLTVYAPGKSWIAGNNERIHALPGKFPNVKVLDWAAQAANVKLCPDKIHISCSPESPRAYANLIFEALGRPDLVKT
ncbi:MAG TPA: acyltransferase family protein, partial [Ilumatobacteraceae bacterium]|nr:acyltransferase family protein [Ilumatobacteraceae bacterium]